MASSVRLFMIEGINKIMFYSDRRYRPMNNKIKHHSAGSASRASVKEQVMSLSPVLRTSLHQRLQMSSCESVVLTENVFFSMQHLETNLKQAFLNRIPCDNLQ